MAEQKQVTFTLNGQQVVTPVGTLVIEAAKKQSVEVPSFCYFPGGTPSSVAPCRMCLVEVEKMPKLQTACTLVATEGMVVKSDTEQVHKAGKDMLEFLPSNHPPVSPQCTNGGGARAPNALPIPNEPGNLACEECAMCIDICPVGASPSGPYRYQTRPWE